MTNCKRYKVAAIDLGTVSSRLVLAQVEGGAIVESSKHTEITDLGEGVDATGRFCEAAVERVLAACRMFVDEARAFGAACICTTCTSAARDASNATLLLDGLRDLGLEPQVIPGEVEARLTFFGVAHDFAGERIIVADSGGGSTELATGVYAPERGVFALEGTRSLDIGCRRVTERFFSALPPTDSELAAAGVWAGEQFGAYFEGLPVDFERAERLVAVGVGCCRHCRVAGRAAQARGRDLGWRRGDPRAHASRRLRHAHRKREQPPRRHGRHHQRDSRRRDSHHRLDPHSQRPLNKLR